MGAKFSKGGKGKQNGSDATHDESLDTFNKTSTLPASFRKKDDEVTKAGTLPRGGVDLDRNKSFSKRFRKSISKLVGQNEVKEEASDSQAPSDLNTVVINDNEKKEKLEDAMKEEVDSKLESTPTEIDIKTAQKIARAKFFQDLYSKEPANIPKPPRSRNIPSPIETDADVPVSATLGTPVVKLIKKHEGEIEKQQELIGTNNSINFPEKETKDAESPQDIQECQTDVVCASKKQVGEIKQEEVSPLKGETNSMEEEFSQAAMPIKQETSKPITEEKSENCEDFKEASPEKIDLPATREAVNNIQEPTTNVGVVLINSAENFQNQPEDELIEQETIVTPLKEESLMTQTTEATSNEMEDKKEISLVSTMNLESTVEESSSLESKDSAAIVENTEDQIGSTLCEETPGKESESDDKEPLAISETKSGKDSDEESREGNTEKVVECNSEQKDSEMTKDNGDDSPHNIENKAIGSQEEEKSLIDQSSSCNAQRDNTDDNNTEPNSLESINQTDEINQSVTEEKSVESTGTGESDLVKETVIVENDIRSEGGSDEGVSTDEGIVASDDEENKLEVKKVNNLEASESKTVSEDTQPGNEL